MTEIKNETFEVEFDIYEFDNVVVFIEKLNFCKKDYLKIQKSFLAMVGNIFVSNDYAFLMER
jgi:hypothetical protein